MTPPPITTTRILVASNLTIDGTVTRGILAGLSSESQTPGVAMKRVLTLALLLFGYSSAAVAQYHEPGAMSPPGGQGSSNVHVLSHVSLGRVFTVGDIE